ncbi:transporter [Lysobacter niabensis]|uniref:transporter n=1 Tax=Agrilutibacter niabensis TaxID=380628 RepID=UPI00360CAF07
MHGSPDGWVRRHLLPAALVVPAVAGIASTAHAQDIEPRAYSNAPVGVNFVIAGGVVTRGGLSFDSSVPITNANLHTSSAVLAYARVLDLHGKSGKFDVIVPYTRLVGTADYQGQPVERAVTGFGRPAFRLSINLHGAPALRLQEFGAWKQDLIVGASLQVSPPWGQYDADRIVNIGSNRWSFKPEIGISKAIGPWTLEVQAAAVFFTDNKDFYGGNTRSQRPLYSLQGHVIHGFRSGTWISFDGTYFAGGRSTINDALSNDLQQNWRVGAILAVPVNRLNSIKFSASSGVSARTGNNFDAIGVAWQYRWGGGL